MKQLANEKYRRIRFWIENKRKCDPGRPPKKIKVVAKSSENKRGPGRPPKKSLTVPSFTKKPRGRPPLNTSGEPAEWDEESGTWIGVEKKKSTKNKTSIGSVMRVISDGIKDNQIQKESLECV